MLTKLYIEALLVDEELADQEWELWDQGLISDEVAAWAWWLMLCHSMSDVPQNGHSSSEERTDQSACHSQCTTSFVATSTSIV